MFFLLACRQRLLAFLKGRLKFLHVGNVAMQILAGAKICSAADTSAKRHNARSPPLSVEMGSVMNKGSIAIAAYCRGYLNAEDVFERRPSLLCRWPDNCGGCRHSAEVWVALATVFLQPAIFGSKHA